ncbi:MAG: hypothetical protein QOJ65_381 [Fimbriimonadaceae bacterium]|jgi:hypothetical protein|nr:hypothetical protein [Fimbriimonadaceae bacterium]
MAAPLVTFTKTGSAGDWTLNLSVTNTLGIDDQKIYFFGVKLDDRDIAGSPSGWNPDSWIAWTNAPFGGSTEVYNNNWLSPTEADAIHNGDTLSGFLVHSTSTDAPTSVKWFAFSDGRTPYTGGDNFNATTNPGFEGVAGEAVPEPATALVLAGMIGLGALKRRRAR